MPETVSLKGSEITADSSVSIGPTKIGALLAVNYSPEHRKNMETVDNKFSLFEYKKFFPVGKRYYRQIKKLFNR